MFGRSTSSFDRLIEKATSQLLLEPDWDSIIQICDCIRQADVQPKYVLSSLKKKVNQDNPHVTLYALGVLESIMKNCGASIHDEVATKDFMEFLKDIISKRPDPVKAKVLELVQVWSHAFRNQTKYKAVQDLFNLLKVEGHSFPQLREADAMFSSEQAPEWKDGECCHRCRVQFSTFQRKHHCRACGQVFCAKCSAKNSIIPKFGIEKEVRVCDSCFDQLNKTETKKDEDELPAEYLKSPLSRQQQVPPQNKTAELEQQEEEELQLALAISQSEAEAKSKERERMKLDYNPYGNSSNQNKKTAEVYSQPAVTAPVLDTSDMDPELARYLNRNYWEQRGDSSAVSTTSTTTPSAPAPVSEPVSTVAKTDTKLVSNGDADETTSQDEVQFLAALQKSVDIFVNRMKSNSSRGRSIANDSSVQTLFMTINAMHPQLMKYMQETEDKRTYYEGLQDKLAQLKDARDALGALREEHREKKRREEEELERQRAIQMAHKLEVLRQQKQVYLEQQRQLELQRMEELRRDMEMRLEQQKQMQQMRAMQYSQQMYAQAAGMPTTFSPPSGGSAESSPLHQPHTMPAGGGGYMPQQPGVPGMMGVPPGAPGMSAPHSMPHMQPQTIPPTSSMAMSAAGYSVPGAYQPPPAENTQAPTAYQPQSAYPGPGQQQAYQQSPYNMQGLATALPGHPGQAGMPPPQPGQQPGYQPHYPAPGTMQPGQPINMPPAHPDPSQPHDPQQHLQQQPQPQPQPPPQQQQESNEQLISFD